MKYRLLGKTGFEVSEISLGTWQVGGKWGSKFDHKEADKILNLAFDNGVNFIDTADVYENGESERAVGKFIKSKSEKIYVATKCGRFISPHINENYKPEKLRTYVENSLKNIGIETIDLIQLHCPPTEVYYRPEIFELFDRLKEEGKIQKLGVSVEKVEEAIKAIEFENVDTVQIIFNIFRQRPNELFFKLAKKKNIGILARVPLASGMLTGKFSKNTNFGEGDHRNFNRNGEKFDKGETFSGVDYEKGLLAVNQLVKKFPEIDLVNLALKWILMHKEVSCVIPGASRPQQVVHNVEASEKPPLSFTEMEAIQQIYDQLIKKDVHQLW